MKKCKYMKPSIDTILMIDDDIVATSTSNEGNENVNCPTHNCFDEYTG